MRAWKVVVLVDLALLLGLGIGYVFWGRQAARLEREVAAGGAPTVAGEQTWRVRGVVRAILPEIDAVVLTHEEIRGYMPAMTMAFRAASPAVYAGVHVGDEVTFTLRGTPPRVALVAIERDTPRGRQGP